MAASVGKFTADFCFKYGKYSWRERYYHMTADSYAETAAGARRLAQIRLGLIGYVGIEIGDVSLDRIIISKDDVQFDSEEVLDYRDDTASYGTDAFLGKPAADPRFCILWRTSSQNGFGKPREMAGIPAYLLAKPHPAADADFLKAFQKFANILGGEPWGYLQTGAGPSGSVENPISYIGNFSPKDAAIFAKTLPVVGQHVEIRYARFAKGKPRVSGDFPVTIVGAGFFVIDVGEIAPNLHYRSGGIWRLPAPRLTAFDGSSIIVGLTARKRGFKLHAEKGRQPRRGAIIF